jgi:hypothetical protein
MPTGVLEPDLIEIFFYGVAALPWGYYRACPPRLAATTRTTCAAAALFRVIDLLISAFRIRIPKAIQEWHDGTLLALGLALLVLGILNVPIALRFIRHKIRRNGSA